MGTSENSPAGSRQERRKAATRAKILGAAERLFGERGYAETSIEDISELADVAVRTIYTHFPSKAAIMLAAFDAWVDVFVAEVLRRPLEEPVAEAVRQALRAMTEAGFEDHPEDGSVAVHPMVGHLHSGAPDIAGHVLQRWMREMDRIANDAVQRGDYPEGSLEPQARATAVFAGWIAVISAAEGRRRGRRLPANATGHGLGAGVLELLTSGRI